MSRVDILFRKLALDTLYTKGWGSPAGLTKIIDYRRKWVCDRDTCAQLVPHDIPITIDKELTFKNHSILDGSFRTPLSDHMPELIPEVTRQAHFQLILPNKWPSKTTTKSSSSSSSRSCSKKKTVKPVVFHYAGTGDHYYWRRRVMLAKPLLAEHQVGSLLIENPFYGLRKPKEQNRSQLLHVIDLFVMGALLVTESLVLMRWLEKLGYGPFVLTGLSMGGHMACLSSSIWPYPLGLVPCLSWTTASSTFTRGVMSSAVDWNQLEKDYFSDPMYAELNARLKELHRSENETRASKNKKLVCAFSNEPKNVEFDKLINLNGKSSTRRELIEFMHLLMDECTHLLHYNEPCDTSLIHVIAAKDDAYILRDGVNDFKSVWPGSHEEYLEDQGHVSSFLLSQKKFREAIITTLDKMLHKYYI